MKTIARMTRLRCLHLGLALYDDHVFELAPICPQLQELSLIGERHCLRSPLGLLSDESIVFIANNCQDLKVLNISANDKLTSKGVNEVIKNLYNLQTITVHRTTFDLNELKKRPNGFPSLKIIKAGWGIYPETILL